MTFAATEAKSEGRSLVREHALAQYDTKARTCRYVDVSSPIQNAISRIIMAFNVGLCQSNTLLAIGCHRRAKMHTGCGNNISTP